VDADALKGVDADAGEASEAAPGALLALAALLQTCLKRRCALIINKDYATKTLILVPHLRKPYY
jgi:hypothetical protein